MQTQPVNTLPPVRGLRPGALLVGCGINLIGALIVVFAVAPDSPKLAGSWLLVQFISGVWAGVFGANSPFLHGVIAGLPGLLIALLWGPQLPWPFAVMCGFMVPAAALVATAIMRYMRRRGP